jgi:hypothetical protein
VEPLHKPDHLDGNLPNEWLVKHAAGVLALVLGSLAFIVVAVSQTQFWASPDWRISVPAFALTAAAAIAAIVRKEHSSTLWLLGLGLAAAALVLGWVVMLAIIIGATAILILIFHSVL